MGMNYQNMLASVIGNNIEQARYEPLFLHLARRGSI